MHATSDYNMKTTIHEGRMWRWARSYDAPGMTPTPEMMRLKPQDLGGWLAGPAQPDPETRGAGWHPRAFYSLFPFYPKPRAKNAGIHMRNVP